ncbi:MAG: UvrD-helicase domain-containing protein, partial [bacterium]|nr:UvrD-helicase domain-containing protein [bacterium]
MNEFEIQYKKLNKAQKEAVDTIEGPVMVIAGPGTGKTQILTLRIANILLKTDTPPGGILALTFTEAGAKEMKRRLRGIIGPQANDIRIHTYHGFANSIINEFDDHFPHLSRTKQITEVEAEMLVRDILKEKRFAKLRPFGEPDFYVDKIISTISDAKKEAWTPEMVRTFATDEIKRIENDEESISSRGPTKGKLKADALKRIEKCERTILFANVYEAYEKLKKDERKIDYDDLIIELLLALR